ncbi:MAG: glycosyl transferase, partial [Aestuariibacter sp.]|nr:glycosyl transferase [Aestuariibacter sp.]
SGARSLMIPFAGDGETEQNDRAQALENTGRVLRIAEPDLTPGNLARAIDRALEMEPVKIKVDMNGAANSALLIAQKLQEWST